MPLIISGVGAHATAVVGEGGEGVGLGVWGRETGKRPARVSAWRVAVVVWCKRAWKAEMISNLSSLPGLQPARMVPPYTMIDGRLTRAMAMMQPGMFLSHPGMDRLAS